MFRTPTADKPFRFVSIGECMVEMAPADSAGQYQMGFAGDTLNTVWYLAALRPDWQTDYVTRVGRDAVSDQMAAMMADAGIGTAHVGRSEDRSVGLYMISLSNGERSFSYWRDQSAARQLADDAATLASAGQGADLIYFSGITLAILDDAGRDTLLQSLAEARAAGARIAFDSNLRPRLWLSTDAMCAAVMAAAAISDIVLPSFDDEAVFFGDATLEVTLARYLAAGASTVVVKNGPGEVLFTHQGAKGMVEPEPATAVVDTTSAGDSFNAGLFAELVTTGDMQSAIRAASDVARQVIARRGALVSLNADARKS